MTTPTCGHTDGWCGGIFGNNHCSRTTPRTPAPEGMDEQDLWDQTHGPRRIAPDDYYERAGSWER